METAERAIQSALVETPQRNGPGAARPALRRQCVLLLVASAAASLLAGMIWIDGESGSVAVRSERANQLANDARMIATLRSKPTRVSEAALPNDDLLDRTSRAMRQAGIEAAALVSTLPQPPRRTLGSDRAEVATRLLFENITLKSLLELCRQLCPPSNELRVTGIQLRAAPQLDRWNVDLTIAYWVIVVDQRRSAVVTRTGN